MKARVLLYGGASQARLVASMVADQGAEVAAIFDATLEQPTFATSVPFSNASTDLARFIDDCSRFVVCIGAEHGLARCKIADALVARQLEPLTVTPADFVADSSVHISPGVLIMPGVVINKFAHVGEQSVLNTGCTVDHECRIGRGVHVMGAAALAGRVVVEDFATVGTNATVLPDITVGQSAYVGAGAVVTRPVPANQVVVGVPARFLREHQPGYDLAPFDALPG